MSTTRRAISIHALREEGDGRALSSSSEAMYFYPRPPRGGRRVALGCSRLNLIFLSTPSARRATGGWAVERCIIKISIHALREEGDNSLYRRHSERLIFLSTPSARRATWSFFFMVSSLQFLSTPSARRATTFAAQTLQLNNISIHALREEGDVYCSRDFFLNYTFLSTPSARRATLAS